LSKKRRRRSKKRRLFNKGLVRLAAAALVVGCAVLTVSTEKECAEKEQQLAKIQEKIDAYDAENKELQRTLESDDLSAYMEKIALEERGYAYPDERRFYDTSRD
jgi:tRNA G46 methylase TrmB